MVHRLKPSSAALSFAKIISIVPTIRLLAPVESVEQFGAAIRAQIDLRIEATGIRNPVGLAFNDVGTLFMTNQGMKMVGTRPVKDDPDALLKVVHGQWYGWPDFSTTLQNIFDPKFQPPVEMIVGLPIWAT